MGLKSSLLFLFAYIISRLLLKLIYCGLWETAKLHVSAKVLVYCRSIEFVVKCKSSFSAGLNFAVYVNIFFGLAINNNDYSMVSSAFALSKSP